MVVVFGGVASSLVEVVVVVMAVTIVDETEAYGWEVVYGACW